MILLQINLWISLLKRHTVHICCFTNAWNQRKKMAENTNLMFRQSY
uniref:Ubiquitin specific protease 34 n=1 Tax=Pan troglodytes TaxID=9598 RepID=G2HG39_PANTR|nr:ubiquitin specific protease 34 [Pan troglodytes]